MDFDTALDLVMQQCAADTYPELDFGDVLRLLQATLQFTTWQAGNAYVYGDVVVPIVRNGHKYRAISAGTAGATEPFWPLYTSADDRIGLTSPYYVGTLPNAEVTDGSVIWVEAGTVSASAYDVRRATYNAWRIKAARASADTDFKAGQLDVKQSGVIASCLTMAQRFAPTQIA